MTYDEQIAKCTDQRSIAIEFISCSGIFKTIGNDIPSASAGCLIMIKARPLVYKAIVNGKVDEELTERIINDPLIPMSTSDITPEVLQHFKAIHEMIDTLIIK